MVWNGIKEKPHRLDPSLYVGIIRCDFTAKLRDRKAYFNSAEAFEHHEALLLTSLEKRSCVAPLYLFMPDHLHVIVEGTTDDSDLRACMADFKQRSGFSLSQDTQGALHWQKDFFDRIIRNEREFRTKMNYILMNPVRAGLADSWKQYPYWGSTVYRKEDLIMGMKY